MKRLTAVALMLALCLCLCSCGYNPLTVGQIVSADGKTVDIPCGRYLIAQFMAADTAMYTFDPSGTTGVADLLNAQIEGTPARDWIRAETEEILLRAEAVDRVCEEKGLELGADKLYLYEYSIGYGWSTYRDLYMRNGIGYESFYDCQMNMAYDMELANLLYGTGAPLELPAAEVLSRAAADAARVDVAALPYVRKDGSALSEDMLKLVDALAAQFAADADELGLAGAVEKYTPAYEEILGAGCMDGVLEEDALAIRGDGQFTPDEYDVLLGLEPGGKASFDEGSHSYKVAFRRALKESDTADALRDPLVAAIGSGMVEEFLKDYMNGWKTEYDPKAVKYYSVDKITFQ